MRKKGFRSLLFAMTISVLFPATTFAKGNEVIPDSEAKLISEKKIEKLSDWELRAARCEITARHGKKIYAQDMKDYFENVSWYHPTDDYDISSLNDIEKKNIQLLYDEELERKQEYAREQFEENQRISASGEVQVMSSSFVYMDSTYSYDDLVGIWVDDEDPTYPTVLEITEKDGQFYYEYYFISPGNSAGIGIAVTYTKWGRWKGLLELNTENGYVTCYNGDTKESGIFQTFVYDVMSDRFVETSNDPYRESFEKNDEYEYEL